MKPIRNIVILKANPEKHQWKSLGKDPKGKEINIWIDPDFNPHEKNNVCQDGIIVEVPMKLSKEFGELDIKKNDHVYTHHFLSDKDQSIPWNDEKNCFRLLYEQIYAIEEKGNITMVGFWNFCEPVYETDDRPFVPDHLKVTRSHNTAIVRHLSKKLKERGELKEGDKIVFKKNMDYLMIVEGEDMYRIHDSDIVAVLTS